MFSTGRNPIKTVLSKGFVRLAAPVNALCVTFKHVIGLNSASQLQCSNSIIYTQDRIYACYSSYLKLALGFKFSTCFLFTFSKMSYISTGEGDSCVSEVVQLVLLAARCPFTICTALHSVSLWIWPHSFPHFFLRLEPARLG